MEHVLIVEDEANILKLVAVNLQSRGYNVAEATNGTEALAQIQKKRPSLIVLDVKLPDFTGWDLLRQLKLERKNMPEIRVLIMTASISDSYINLDLFPNVSEILIKPFSSGRLLAAVEHALNFHLKNPEPYH